MDIFFSGPLPFLAIGVDVGASSPAPRLPLPEAALGFRFVLLVLVEGPASELSPPDSSTSASPHSSTLPISLSSSTCPLDAQSTLGRFLDGDTEDVNFCLGRCLEKETVVIGILARCHRSL